MPLAKITFRCCAGEKIWCLSATDAAAVKKANAILEWNCTGQEDNALHNSSHENKLNGVRILKGMKVHPIRKNLGKKTAQMMFLNSKIITEDTTFKNYESRTIKITKDKNKLIYHYF